MDRYYAECEFEGCKNPAERICELICRRQICKDHSKLVHYVPLKVQLAEDEHGNQVRTQKVKKSNSSKADRVCCRYKEGDRDQNDFIVTKDSPALTLCEEALQKRIDENKLTDDIDRKQK